ncbi:hypothetical protein IW262DRAFT_1297987 [Armillaria fumosa]|nr:hypothetical protein IW262DRAFT_1297987 [Armillaria fumosa]
MWHSRTTSQTLPSLLREAYPTILPIYMNSCPPEGDTSSQHKTQLPSEAQRDVEAAVNGSCTQPPQLSVFARAPALAPRDSIRHLAAELDFQEVKTALKVVVYAVWVKEGPLRESVENRNSSHLAGTRYVVSGQSLTHIRSMVVLKGFEVRAFTFILAVPRSQTLSPIYAKRYDPCQVSERKISKQINKSKKNLRHEGFQAMYERDSDDTMAVPNTVLLPNIPFRALNAYPLRDDDVFSMQRAIAEGVNRWWMSPPYMVTTRHATVEDTGSMEIGFTIQGPSRGIRTLI